ncbi:hypothetical protein POTOM_014241 [Populus tomentosa]|uniref:eRF1 domain-containing protein n=1 Tax=Populus tomentosa TaxID=118781 RepID=A0A8X8D7M9_POPTO|nr:hypothetical protein POTOM_014241 [Populus tomentosa]
MISLLVRPWDQICKVTKMPSKELCRMNSKFVQDALSYALQKLKLYTEVPTNGTLRGNRREVLSKLTVELPWKHGRGGQSALRFDRRRTESRHYYVRKAAELSIKHFIDPSDALDWEVWEEVSEDSGKFVYGLEDAMKDLGIWEDFFGYKSDSITSSTSRYKTKSFFWNGLRNEYKPFGCSLETVTDNSEEDVTFVEDLVALEGSFAIRWTLNHLINQKFMKTLRVVWSLQQYGLGLGFSALYAKNCFGTMDPGSLDCGRARFDFAHVHL